MFTIALVTMIWNSVGHVTTQALLAHGSEQHVLFRLHSDTPFNINPPDEFLVKMHVCLEVNMFSVVYSQMSAHRMNLPINLIEACRSISFMLMCYDV